MKRTEQIDPGLSVLAIAVGGKGSRMGQHFSKIGFSGPKVLFPVQGKPLLGWYLDHAEQSGFTRIVLLLNHFESDIREFLKTRHRSDMQIECITSDDQAQRTVPGLLSLFVKQYTGPIAYMDGNLFFDPSLFDVVKKVLLPNETQARVFVSRADIAPTHAQFIASGSKVVDIISRPHKHESSRRDERAIDQAIFCSMGIFVIRPELLLRVSRSGPQGDLDQVIEYVFDSSHEQNPTCIDYQEYVGPWAALHTSADIDRMLRIAYNAEI